MRAWEFITEHRLEWGRKRATSRGGKTAMKWRCTSGPRKGRLVSQVADCDAFVNAKQREKMKTIRAKTSKPQARRSARSKKINTASRLVRKLNKMRSQSK